jgi:hypothetical protein
MMDLQDNLRVINLVDFGEKKERVIEYLCQISIINRVYRFLEGVRSYKEVRAKQSRKL